VLEGLILAERGYDIGHRHGGIGLRRCDRSKVLATRHEKERGHSDGDDAVKKDEKKGIFEALAIERLLHNTFLN